MMRFDIKRIILNFYDPSGEMLAGHPMIALPVREDELIRKSMEYFADPTPCMMHRSAVVQRLYTELIDFLSAHLVGAEGDVSWQDIPRPVKKWIDLAEPAKVGWVEVRQKQA